MLLFKKQCPLQPSVVAHAAHTKKKNKIIHQTAAKEKRKNRIKMRK